MKNVLITLAVCALIAAATIGFAFVLQSSEKEPTLAGATPFPPLICIFSTDTTSETLRINAYDYPAIEYYTAIGMVEIRCDGTTVTLRAVE